MDDSRVLSLFEANVEGCFEDGSSHGSRSFQAVSPRKTRLATLTAAMAAGQPA
jgi:hypothetical protein